ncbi:hypothetical protein IMSAG049_01687 [Clostridiales bacterium]|nr:hypothetical protein IMSAG049_01687 [Clostridiales bacterium]
MTITEALGSTPRPRKSQGGGGKRNETDEELSDYEKELVSIDLPALREVSEDVIGWIAIPGTEVFYPLMRAEDNSYYLNHTWNGAASSVGSIFLEYRNPSDLSGFNSIIYGHQMMNGSMFGGLSKFVDEDYLKEHPLIYIVTDNGVQQYDIFAASEVGVQSVIYKANISKEESRQEMIDFSVANSVVDTGIVPSIDGHIITLSTCTGRGYDTRWIVQGVLRE